MSQSKNEIPALVAALGITAALVGGGAWWLMSSGVIGSPAQPETTATGSPVDGGEPIASASGGAATFAEVAGVPSGRFTYGGSTTWAPVRGAADPIIKEALPNFKLIYQDAAGSGDGITKLIAGDLDFAQSSRPLKTAEKQQVEQAGLELREIPVATEAVAIAINPDLDIPGLTLDQLKDIYTGKLTNWSQVGGPNIAIVPASRGKTGGTVDFFKETVLEGQAFTPNTQRLTSTTAALRFVSQTPGAIYFASAPEVVGQCTVKPIPIGTSESNLIAPYQAPYVAPDDCPVRRNRLNLTAFGSGSYPMTRSLYVIIRQDGQPAQQAGEAYINLLQTNQGKQLLTQAGFVPLP